MKRKLCVGSATVGFALSIFSCTRVMPYFHCVGSHISNWKLNIAHSDIHMFLFLSSRCHWDFHCRCGNVGMWMEDWQTSKWNSNKKIIEYSQVSTNWVIGESSLLCCSWPITAYIHALHVNMPPCPVIGWFSVMLCLMIGEKWDFATMCVAPFFLSTLSARTTEQRNIY